ncbi:hypothetical protein EDB85DRAFT_2281906 [Lactarius pseudohatsudake]|nr:hypothetical protein EDB85DRAFT_2281906 [Lactarius pseudohatsudake]
MSGTENDTHDPVDAGLFRPQQESQTPEPNSLSEVQSTESAHLGKDPSLPVEGIRQDHHAQQSLQEFINALSPGAYFSVVNFKILGDVVPKPFRIYGSKEEIMRWANAPRAARRNRSRHGMDRWSGSLSQFYRRGYPSCPRSFPCSVQNLRGTQLSAAPSLVFCRFPNSAWFPQTERPQEAVRRLKPHISPKHFQHMRQKACFGHTYFQTVEELLRYTTIKRKNSSLFSRPADDGDEAAISITPCPPRQASPERTRDAPSSSANAHDSPISSPLSRLPLDGELVVVFNPEPPLSPELSKHLTALGGSHMTDLSGNRYSSGPGASLPSPGTDDNKVVAPDTSVPDLSTSRLKEVVMHALKERPSTNGWLTGVVVEDLADSYTTIRNHQEAHEGYTEVEPEESLHLDALDPDLAAFLSPNPQPRGGGWCSGSCPPPPPCSGELGLDLRVRFSLRQYS